MPRISKEEYNQITEQLYSLIFQKFLEDGFNSLTYESIVEYCGNNGLKIARGAIQNRLDGDWVKALGNKVIPAIRERIDFDNISKANIEDIALYHLLEFVLLHHSDSYNIEKATHNGLKFLLGLCKAKEQKQFKQFIGDMFINMRLKRVPVEPESETFSL